MLPKLALILSLATATTAAAFFDAAPEMPPPITRGEPAKPKAYDCHMIVSFDVPAEPAPPSTEPLPLPGVTITYTGTGCEKRWREAINQAASAVAMVAP
jgi:hypothetical protein